MTTPRFHRLVPGASLDGDWYPDVIPANIVVGRGCAIDSSFCFKHFFARREGALRIGDEVTIWRTSLAVEDEGRLEIGSQCYLANASIVCSARITLGNRVFVAGGVTIVDGDFHPLSAASRLADTIALSPTGNLASGRPVVVQDTGFSRWLPTGRGVLAFSSPDEAVDTLEDIERRYEEHCQAARQLVEDHFSAETVLVSMIERSFASDRPLTRSAAAPPEQGDQEGT